MSRPKLAVAYDLSAASPFDLRTALGGVCDLVWVVDLAEPAVAGIERVLRRFGTVVDTGGRTTEEVVDELRELGVAGAVAFCDAQLPLAAALASALGLAGNPTDVVERLTEKHAQRTALRDAGLACPAFVAIPPSASVAEAMAAVDGLRYPMVLKPARGASSRGVAVVADAVAAEAWFGATADRRAEVGAIAEEFLADRTPPGERSGLGDYVSIEAMVVDGEPVPLALTGKFAIAERFRETGNFMPHHLDASEAREIVELGVAAARALGVWSGALHIEVKLTPGGPVVIELNGRVGGGAIDSLYELRRGTSLTTLAALVALGEPVELVAEEVAAHSGPFHFEHFVQPPVGVERLTAIRGANDLVGVAGVEAVALHLSPGDAIDWSIGSLSFVLRATGTAADLDALRSVPSEVLAAGGIDYE